MKEIRGSLLGQPARIPAVCEGPGEPGLVSVLIPTYNRGYILGSAIESVLAQTYRPIEIVVVDDGSTDETPDVLKRFGDAIRVIRQENRGLAGARNTGLAVARGEFIAFEDSDDFWLPWKLEAQIAFMRAVPELALTWTDMSTLDEHGALLHERHLRAGYSAYEHIRMDETFPHSGSIREIWPDCPPEIRDERYRYGNIFTAMFFGNLVHPPTALMRREHVRLSGGLDETFNMTSDDYEFFWRVSSHGLGGILDVPSMNYRIGATDQITHMGSHEYLARGHLAALNRTLERDRKRIELPDSEIRKSLAEANAWVAETLFHSGKSGAAGYFWNSLRCQPLQKRALMLFPLSLLPRPVTRGLRNLKGMIKSRLSPRKN